MQPEGLKMIQQRKKKGLLLPVLELADDMTLAPDVESSVRLYQSFKSNVKLASAGESLQFYQRLLASVEHTCPENATRKVENCSFRKLKTFGGLFSDDSVYDLGRLERWFDAHSSVGYLIMGPVEVYNSRALLHSRYSPNSRALTETSVAQRKKDIPPQASRLRLDWVELPGSNKPLFKSRGYCSLSLLESEGQSHQLDQSHQPDKSNRKEMMAHFIDFMDKAWAEMPMPR